MDRFPKIFTVRFGRGQENQDPWNDPFGSHRFIGRPPGWTPHTDILETEDAVMIVMDLAGVGNEDFRVTVEGDLLKVTGVRNKKMPPGLKRFHRMEVEYGPFEKIFRVPSERVDVDNIQAVRRDGFLELTCPKRKTEETTHIVIVHEDSY